MNLFQALEEFILGAQAFYLNQKLPNDLNYWEEQNKSLPSVDLKWADLLNGYLLFSSNKGSSFHLHEIINDEIEDFDISPRIQFFYKKIDIICNQLLTNISNFSRLGKSIAGEDILKKLRWYIQEVILIEDRYKIALIRHIKSSDEWKVNESEILTVSNYFTIGTLKWKLILVYRQINIIENNPILDWKEDSLIKSVLVENYDWETFNFFYEYTIRIFYKNIHRVYDLHSSMQKIYFNFCNSEEIPFTELLCLKEYLSSIENLLFKHDVYQILIANPVNKDSKLDVDDDQFLEDVLYEIRNEVINCDLPSDYLFVYQRKIDIIEYFCEIIAEPRKFHDLDSIPRKLLKKLKLESEAIKANPKIDLKAVFESKTAPIKINLSVAKLALLLRVLVDQKIIVSINKAELFRTVAKIFQTKNQEAISENSLKNKFNIPEDSAIDYWDTKLDDIKDIILDYKR